MTVLSCYTGQRWTWPNTTRTCVIDRCDRHVTVSQPTPTGAGRIAGVDSDHGKPEVIDALPVDAFAKHEPQLDAGIGRRKPVIAAVIDESAGWHGVDVGGRQMEDGRRRMDLVARQAVLEAVEVVGWRQQKARFRFSGLRQLDRLGQDGKLWRVVVRVENIDTHLQRRVVLSVGPS